MRGPLRAQVTLDLPQAPEPPEALRRLHGIPGRVLLQSAGPRGRYSFLGADPFVRVVARDGETSVLGEGVQESFPDPYSAIEEVLARYRLTPSTLPSPFSGGLVGFLAYEAGGYLERLPPPPPDDVGAPQAWFGVYDRAVVWDRESGRCVAVGRGRSEMESRERAEAIAARVIGSSPVPPPVSMSASGMRHASDSPFVSSASRDDFIAGVERIREYIRAGDLFQANLTRRISVRTPIPGVELYGRLLAESPAEFSAYLDTGQGEVISVSPELFLSVRGLDVRTGPIKGTAPRGRTPDEDRALAEALLSSAKDQAENVMIVDLLRNDLSRVCRPGSIRVPALAVLESQPTVHHLVSHVVGRLEEGKGAVDLLRATFPGGSITGAPKIRAMEVLAELEPVRRGVYTGALGMLSFSGDVELSIAIRTALLRDGTAHYGTGAGITLASDPEAEWRETEDKARAFVRALSPSSPPARAATLLP